MGGPAGGSTRAGVVLDRDGTTSAALALGARPVVLPPLPSKASAADVVDSLIRAGADIGLITVDMSAVLDTAVLGGQERLPAVAVVRIVPRAATSPALAVSPASSVERLVGRRYTLLGGHDILGHELRPLDPHAVAAVAADIAASSIRHVAVVGAGAQARPLHERAVADAVQSAVPDAFVSLASDFGGQGFAAREATAVLNVALAPLVSDQVSQWSGAVNQAAPAVVLRFARGDGGSCTPARMALHPVVALSATDALELAGAAWLAAQPDCHIVLRRGGGELVGTVGDGLPSVRPDGVHGIGSELVVPRPALTPLVDRQGLGRLQDRPLVDSRYAAAPTAAVGAAISRPTAWLDEVVFIRSSEELERLELDAERRALAFVTANGAAPESAVIIERASIAVPYSPFGTVRVRIRAAGAREVLLPSAPDAGRAA